MRCGLKLRSVIETKQLKLNDSMTDPSKSKFNLLLAEDEMNCQLDKHQQKNHAEWFECKVRPLPLVKASDQGVIHPPSRGRGPGDKLCTFNLRSVNTHQWDPTRGVEHRVEEKIPPMFRKRSWKWLRFLRAEQKKSPGEKFQEPQSSVKQFASRIFFQTF